MYAFFFLLFIAGYLVGSVPFAYLLTKRKHGLDIRTLGSGNVGARNVFEVTADKRTSVLVLCLDVLKGIAAVALYSVWVGPLPGLISLSLGVVAGHCYPVWLKFHGGRGLAAAAGILLAVCPLALALWLTAYWLSSIVRSQVHLNAMIALLVVALAVVSVPDGWIVQSNLWSIPPTTIRGVVLALFIVLFSRHLGPVWQYARSIES
jgi:glycerol-3-phosphate acyltransferase PlsY